MQDVYEIITSDEEIDDGFVPRTAETIVDEYFEVWRSLAGHRQTRMSVSEQTLYGFTCNKEG